MFITMTRQRKIYKNLGKNRMMIRRTRSGAAGCYVTVAVRGTYKFIIAEINYDTKEIRLKLTNSELNGVKLTNGTFTLPIRFCDNILPKEVKVIGIELKKNNDGWWYGNYECDKLLT
ncbi:hypothetical protein Q0R11_21625 [Escherichia coli :H21]